jgi:Carboxypeptidase regulatory-like domain
MKIVVRFGASVIWVAAGLLWGGGSALAYQSVDVTNGGTLTGKVTLTGGIPKPRAFPIVLYAFGDYCKKISDGKGHVLLHEFNIDETEGLQDAVISIQGINKGKRFHHIRNEYVSTNCMFHPADVPDSEQFAVHDGVMHHVHPLVSVMENHQPIYVGNRDPVLHNGQVYQKEKGLRVLNFPVPVSDDLHGGYVHFGPGNRIMEMICGMHEYMQAWGWMVDNPYYAKTRKGGEFTIEEIPPGTYTVTAWHPHMKPIERKVTIEPGGTVSLDFEFDAKTVHRPYYESQDWFRIGPESDPSVDLDGCQGPFCNTR